MMTTNKEKELDDMLAIVQEHFPNIETEWEVADSSVNVSIFSEVFPLTSLQKAKKVVKSNGWRWKTHYDGEAKRQCIQFIKSIV